MDPSVADPVEEGARALLGDGTPRASSLYIDATRKWPYPPTSLPARRYMERALELWANAGLPALQLKEPWFAYELGYWPDERRIEAELAVTGRYYETGTKFAGRRQRLGGPEDPA
jgi:4-hydroxy-3-polyprenylbenzoate decarboxylase